jgi:hypothetical protein
MAGLEPATVYVRRRATSPLRMWLFGALAGVCTLLALTVVHNNFEPSENAQIGAFAELRWPSAWGNQQSLRTSFLTEGDNQTDSSGNETESQTAAPSSAAAPSAPAPFVPVPLASAVSDLSPNSAYLTADLGRSAS